MGTPHSGSFVFLASLVFDTPCTSFVAKVVSMISEAEQFQDWVTGEVLPSIRKHGIYATPQTIEAIKGYGVIKIIKVEQK